MRILPALIYCLLSVACFKTNCLAQPQDKVQQVIVAAAIIGEMSDRIEALGTLRANESITLTASVTETVSVINFEDGQRIEKGSTIAELTNTEERAQLLEAQIRLDEAKRQYDRIKPLAKGGAAPLATVDEKKREYETALAQVQAFESKLNDRLIITPFSGKLGLRNISVGSLVQPGDPITTLDDDSVMKLDFTVAAIYLDSISVGTKIVAKSREFAEESFNGKIYSIDSRIDPVTRSLIVRAIIPNEKLKLKPGLLMTVEIFRNPRQAVIVPEEAIIPEGTKAFLFVADKDGEKLTALKREVTTGARMPGEVEVISGLTKDELVIIHGNNLVRSGQEVKIIAQRKDNESVQELISKNIREEE